MIEDEANVSNIVQQLSAVRSAMGQALNEEIVCALERMNDKKTSLNKKTMMKSETYRAAR